MRVFLFMVLRVIQNTKAIDLWTSVVFLTLYICMQDRSDTLQWRLLEEGVCGRTGKARLSEPGLPWIT